MRAQDRIMLFIDAENANYKALDGVISTLTGLGRVVGRHAHGNWARPGLNGWRAQVERHALRPFQQFGYVAGKNAADAAMIIDAMDALHGDLADAFALMTSDSDFTPLALRLRGAGKAVYGFGNANAASAFKQACTRFVSVAPPAGTVTEAAPTASPGQVVPQNLHATIARVIRALATKDGWADFAQVAAQLAVQKVDARVLGCSKMSVGIGRLGIAELTRRGTPGVLYVRLAPAARAA